MLDTYGSPVPAGVPGELYIGGMGLATEYLNHPEFTFERFIPDRFSGQDGARLYRTGDLARFRSDGTLEHLGRLDDQIKVRGFRVEPSEIEAALTTHPAVDSCAVAMNGNGGLAAWVIPAAHPEIWPAVGEYFLYDHLSYYAMTNDERRNASYRAAIAKLVPGKTVVDVGTGVDALLARFCVEAGARKVYAIEMLPESFDQAAKRLAQSGLERKIHLIYGDATRMNLPEAVDVCVSELLGMIASSEGAATILNRVRRFLKPGGVMIPYRCSTQVAAASLPDALALNPCFTEISGPYVQRIFQQKGHSFDVRVCIDRFPKSHLLSSSDLFEDLDFTHQVPEQFESEIRLTIRKSGRLDGFLLWLTIDTAPGEHLDTLAERTHWLPVFIPVFSPGIEVRVGDSIRGVCSGSLPARAITPDYQFDGYLQCQSGRKDFHFVSSCDTTDFRSNAFYQNLFADGYQNRYVLPSGSINPDALEQHLKLKLPEYMVPSTFVGLSELPRTSSGKLDRHRLQAPVASRAREEFLAPRTALQHEIADIWGDLLKLDMVGLDENFFDLGGHSLLAVRMVSRLRKQFNLAVPLVTVFQHPTIRLLADAMRPGGELD